MPLKLQNNTLLQTDQNIDFYGLSQFSLSIWMRLDPAAYGWTDQNVLFTTTGRHDTMISFANDRIYVVISTHDNNYTYEDDASLAAPPTVGQSYHLVIVFDNGTLTYYINGVVSRTKTLYGTLGALNTSGAKRLMLGCFDQGGFSIQDPAIWTGYALTADDAHALRNRSKTPAQIGSSGSLKWWITLEGTDGHAPAVGDASLTDQSGLGHSITSIPIGTPSYDPASLTFSFPASLSKAFITPARTGLVLFFQDTAGHQVNVQGSAGLVNPTLTTQSLNGGAPLALTNAVWGPSGSYQPWIYYPLPGAIAASDTPTLTVSDPWCSTTAGPVASISGYPVDVSARTSLLPPFSAGPKTMKIGYNASKPPIYFSTVPIYSNHAKQIQGWYGATASFDSFQVPTQVAAGQALYASVVSPANDHTTRDRGMLSACPSGIWSLMWDGQAVDTGTGNPILSLDNGGVSGCSVTPTGTDVLSGTTNNTRLYHVTQDQSQFWSPSIYLIVRGRSDGGLFSPPIANIRVYGPNPENPSQHLTDSPSKFHPSYLNMLVGTRCLRFNLGAATGDITDFTDFLPVGMLGYAMMGRQYGGTIVKIDPYTDSEGYFGNRATALVTFAAPHNAKDGNAVHLHIPGPNADQSFPLTSVAPNDHGWMMDQGANDFMGLCRYNPATMANTQLVYTFNTPSSLSAPCTLTQSWTASGVGQSWYSSPWPSNVTIPGIPPAECCDLANAVGSDLWLSISYNMTDACVDELFALVAQRLSPVLKVYLEYSNETWDTIFQSYFYCLFNGNKTGLTGAQWYTLRASQVHQRAYQALQAASPPRGGDLVRVFGVQGAYAAATTAPITGYAAIRGIPIDVIASSAYFSNMVSPFLGPGGGEWRLNGAYDACNADQLMDLGELFIQYGGYEQNISSHTAYVGPGTAFPNAKIVCYEGGPEVGVPGSNLSDGAYIERNEIWVRHPRMRGIMLHLFQMLQDHGCTLFNDFLVASEGEFAGGHNWNAYYTWNMKPGLGDGSDGLGDNRTFAAPAIVPYQDYNRLVSVVGGAINYWNSLVSGSIPAPTHDPIRVPFMLVALGPSFNGLNSGFNINL